MSLRSFRDIGARRARLDPVHRAVLAGVEYTGQVREGYLRALREAGISVSPDLVANVGEFSIEAGRAGLDRLARLPNTPTAVFATSEVLALSVMAEARALGIAIPGQLAVVGYADTPTAAAVEPPITMAAVPAREVGRTAMRLLRDRVRGRRSRPRRIMVPITLLLRASCGTHPGQPGTGTG